MRLPSLAASAASVLAVLGACAPSVPALPAPATFVETPDSLTTPTGTIYGTLLSTSTNRRGPVVLIHAGSGPTDRNGNSALIKGANNSLRLLAEGLAAQGIATLRFDKRAIGASAKAAGKEQDLRFDTYAEDAAGWLRRLRASGRFTTITALGHSEGALVMLLAAPSGGADGYVSIAGAGRRAGDLLREQLVSLPDSLRAANDRILARLEAGETADTVPPALWSLYRRSVQPYLISWMRRDPATELRGLRMPVLLVQGTTDVQVTMRDFDRLAAARPDAARLVIDGMNHVLKMVRGTAIEQRPAYGDPTLPLAPGLVEGITRFVRALPASPTASSPR